MAIQNWFTISVLLIAWRFSLAFWVQTFTLFAIVLLNIWSTTISSIVLTSSVVCTIIAILISNPILITIVLWNKKPVSEACKFSRIIFNTYKNFCLNVHSYLFLIFQNWQYYQYIYYYESALDEIRMKSEWKSSKDKDIGKQDKIKKGE